MRLAAGRYPNGAVVVIGCAPTALEEVVALAADGTFTPALVIGLPVGFVGAAAAKEAARQSGLRVITNRGDKGGSAVAAALRVNPSAATAPPRKHSAAASVIPARVISTSVMMGAADRMASTPAYTAASGTLMVEAYSRSALA
jgi:hypothetical protein